MYKINTKTLPIGFGEFLQIPSETHYYPTQFVTGDNYSLLRFNRTNLQRSIRYKGSKLWNKLPNEIKNKANRSRHV